MKECTWSPGKHERSHISAQRGTQLSQNLHVAVIQWHLHDMINMVCQQEGYFAEAQEKKVASILATYKDPFPECLWRVT